jgi:predicted DNA-binding transcriptional regulator AlpA
MNLEQPGRVYIGKRKVAARYDTSPRTVDRWRRDSALQFPQPIEINKRMFWIEDELVAWERKRARRSTGAVRDESFAAGQPNLIE